MSRNKTGKSASNQPRFTMHDDGAVANDLTYYSDRIMLPVINRVLSMAGATNLNSMEDNLAEQRRGYYDYYNPSIFHRDREIRRPSVPRTARVLVPVAASTGQAVGVSVSSQRPLNITPASTNDSTGCTWRFNSVHNPSVARRDHELRRPSLPRTTRVLDPFIASSEPTASVSITSQQLYHITPASTNDTTGWRLRDDSIHYSASLARRDRELHRPSAPRTTRVFTVLPEPTVSASIAPIQSVYTSTESSNYSTGVRYRYNQNRRRQSAPRTVRGLTTFTATPESTVGASVAPQQSVYVSTQSSNDSTAASLVRRDRELHRPSAPRTTIVFTVPPEPTVSASIAPIQSVYTSTESSNYSTGVRYRYNQNRRRQSAPRTVRGLTTFTATPESTVGVSVAPQQSVYVSTESSNDSTAASLVRRDRELHRPSAPRTTRVFTVPPEPTVSASIAPIQSVYTSTESSNYSTASARRRDRERHRLSLPRTTRELTVSSEPTVRASIAPIPSAYIYIELSDDSADENTDVIQAPPEAGSSAVTAQTDNKNSDNEVLEMCTVCCNNKADVTLKPCAHKFCSACCRRFIEEGINCPLCRRKIVEYVGLNMK